ncbi:hypothetical protein R6Q57_002315 [Mikania cordata]
MSSFRPFLVKLYWNGETSYVNGVVNYDESTLSTSFIMSISESSYLVSEESMNMLYFLAENELHFMAHIKMKWQTTFSIQQTSCMDLLRGVRMAMCYCGRLATVRTSWTDQNPGRRFYSCPNEASRCQGFLGWLDPPMCPQATVIIPGLLRSKNKLEDEAHLLYGVLVEQMVDASVQQGFLVG